MQTPVRYLDEDNSSSVEQLTDKVGNDQEGETINDVSNITRLRHSQSYRIIEPKNHFFLTLVVIIQSAVCTLLMNTLHSECANAKSWGISYKARMKKDVTCGLRQCTTSV